MCQLGTARTPLAPLSVADRRAKCHLLMRMREAHNLRHISRNPNATICVHSFSAQRLCSLMIQAAKDRQPCWQWQLVAASSAARARNSQTSCSLVIVHAHRAVSYPRSLESSIRRGPSNLSFLWSSPAVLRPAPTVLPPNSSGSRSTRSTSRQSHTRS